MLECKMMLIVHILNSRAKTIVTFSQPLKPSCVNSYGIAECNLPQHILLLLTLRVIIVRHVKIMQQR